MSTTDLSPGVSAAGSLHRGRKSRGSADRRTTRTARARTDGAVGRAESDQLPWAPVFLNLRRLTLTAIGTARHGANYTRQLASIVTAGSPIQPAASTKPGSDAFPSVEAAPGSCVLDRTADL